MMRWIGCLWGMALLHAGCTESCEQRMKRLYTQQQAAFVQQKEVNRVSLQLAYMPADVLYHKDEQKVPVRDTAFYYFRLQVTSLEKEIAAPAAKTALYYGLDSLFSLAEDKLTGWPVLVEPVVTGQPARYEYLLIFNKKDVPAGKELKVFFFDRLFTNTRQVFVFDRTKIDEIETLHCYAPKA